MLRSSSKNQSETKRARLAAKILELRHVMGMTDEIGGDLDYERRYVEVALRKRGITTDHFAGIDAEPVASRTQRAPSGVPAGLEVR